MLPDQTHAAYDRALQAALTEMSEFLEATEAMLADADLHDEALIAQPFYRQQAELLRKRRDDAKAAAEAGMQMAQDFANYVAQTPLELAVGRHLFGLCERYAEMQAGNG